MILTTVTIMTMMFTTTSMILITANHKKGNATNKNKANNKNNKPQPQQKNKKYKYLVHTASNLLSSPNSQKSRPARHDVFHSKPHVPHGWNSGAN